MDESQKQTNSRPWLYKKGQSGNPGGRPKGTKTMKTYVKEKLESMTEEEREVFLNGLSKDIIWEMAEGKAVNKVEGDINLKVEKLEAIQDATKQILGDA